MTSSLPSVPRQPFRVAELRDMPATDVAGMVVGVVGGSAKAVTSTRSSCSIVFLNPELEKTGWVELEYKGVPPAARTRHALATLRGGAMAVVGGETSLGSLFADVHVIQLAGEAAGAPRKDLEPRKWVKLQFPDSGPNVLQALAGHAIVPYRNGFLLHGGVGENNVPNTTLYYVDVQRSVCVQQRNLGIPLMGHSIALEGSTLVLFGGADPGSTKLNRRVYKVDLSKPVDKEEEAAREEVAKPTFWTESDNDDDAEAKNEHAHGDEAVDGDSMKPLHVHSNSIDDVDSVDDSDSRATNSPKRKHKASPFMRRKSTKKMTSKPQPPKVHKQLVPIPKRRRLVAMAPDVTVIEPQNCDDVLNADHIPILHRPDGSLIWCGTKPMVLRIASATSDASSGDAAAASGDDGDDGDGGGAEVYSWVPDDCAMGPPLEHAATSDHDEADEDDDNNPAPAPAQKKEEAHERDEERPTAEDASRRSTPAAAEEEKKDDAPATEEKKAEPVSDAAGAADDEPRQRTPTPPSSHVSSHHSSVHSAHAAPAAAPAHSRSPSPAPSSSLAPTEPSHSPTPSFLDEPEEGPSEGQRTPTPDVVDDAAAEPEPEAEDDAAAAEPSPAPPSDDGEPAADAADDDASPTTADDDKPAEEEQPAAASEDAGPSPELLEALANTGATHAVVGPTMYWISEFHVYAFNIEAGAWSPNAVANVSRTAFVLPRTELPESKSQSHVDPAPAGTAGSTSPDRSRTRTTGGVLSRVAATPGEPVPPAYRPFPPVHREHSAAFDRGASTSRAPTTTLLPPLPPAAPKTARGRTTSTTTTTTTARTSAVPRLPMPKPPHTVRPAGKEFTARGQRKREKQAHKDAQQMALRNLAATGHAETNVVQTLLGGEGGPTIIDIPVMTMDVDLRLLFLIEASLSTRPKVSTINIAGCNVDKLTCQGLVSLIKRAPQILSVNGVETAKLCGEVTADAAAMEDAILNACADNRKRHAAEQEAKKQRKKHARDERKKRRAEERQAATAKVMRKRLWYAQELQVAYLVEAQKIMRGHLVLLERGYIERIAVREAEASYALQEYLLLMERYRARINALGRAEAHARDDVLAEQLKEHATLQKSERESKRKATAVEMAREKRLKVERDSFEKKEKGARGEVRAEEDEARRAQVDDFKVEYFRLKAIHDQIVAEDNARRDREQREIAAAARKKAEEQRQRDALLAQIEENMKQLIRREELGRERDLHQAYGKWVSQFTLDESRDRRRVEALDAKRQREKEREEFATKPPVLSVDKWRANVPCCRGSTGCVPLADDNVLLTIDPVAPEFMGVPGTPTSDLGGSLEATTGRTRRSGSIHRKTSRIPAERARLEEDEVPTAEWLRQKTRPLGFTLTAALDDSADADDEVLLDAAPWRVDAKTGIVTVFPTGDVVGILDPPHAFARPPKPPPPPPESPPLSPQATTVDPVPPPPPAIDFEPPAEDAPIAEEQQVAAAKSPSMKAKQASVVIEEPPKVRRFTFFVPFNSAFQPDAHKLLSTVGQFVGFVRNNVEADVPASGTMSVELNTLQPTATTGYCTDPCVDLLAEQKRQREEEERERQKTLEGAEHDDEDAPAGEREEDGFAATNGSQKSSRPVTAPADDSNSDRVMATVDSATSRAMPDSFGYAFNTATASVAFTIDFVSPILTLNPTIKYTMFTEGDTELAVFPGVPQTAGPNIPGVTIDNPVPSWEDIVLTLDMGPMVQKDDVLWLTSGSGVSMLSNGAVTVDGVTVGMLQHVGNFRALAADDAVAGMATQTEFVFNSTCQTKHVQQLLSAVKFCNSSRNPTDTARFVRATILVASMRLRSDATVGIRFETVDDLTVVELAGGAKHVSFHSDVKVPDELQEYVKPDPFCFAAFSDVYDVDTTDFTGGELRVRIADAHPTDALTFGQFNPLVSVKFDVDSENKLFVKAQHHATIAYPSPSEMVFTFEESSIEVVAAIIRSLAFRTEQNTALLGIPPSRALETYLTVEDAPVVKSVLDIRIANPLLIVPASYATVTYMENGGAVRLCPIDASLDDEGWDGGYVLVKFLSGSTPDDIIGLREDDELQVTDAPAGQNVPMRQIVHSRVPPGTRKRIRDVLLRRRKDMLARRALLRTAYEADRRKMLKLDDIKPRVLWYHGKRIGLLYLRSDIVYVLFDEKMNLDGENRAEQCSIHRNAVAAILKRLTFENTSDDPQDLHKIVTITANDGLPHSNTAVVQVVVQTQDDVTEIHRVSNAPKEFRSESEADRRGYCVFDDCTVYDPDTFAFNDGLLRVDLVGGGDPKGDQLGTLTVAEQERRAPNDPTVTIDEEGAVLVGDFKIGTCTLDAPNPEGHSNIRFAFVPMPEELSRPSTQESPSGIHVPEPAVKSHDEAEGTKGVVTIKHVEKCLKMITYTNKAPKVKPGARVYQASVGFDGCEGKLKLTMNVHAPMLWAPDFSLEIMYKENQPPTAFLPKITINMPEKAIVKEGEITVQVDSTDDNDELAIDARKLTDGVTVSKDRDKVMSNKEFGCRLKQSPGLITLSFDYSSKLTVKQVVSLLRNLTFANKSDSPDTEPRTIIAEYRSAQHELLGELQGKIIVQAEDDPTEITFSRASVNVPRLLPPMYVCADAMVADPDTTEFGDDTVIVAELKGGLATDHLLLMGRLGALERDIPSSHLNPALNRLPSPPSDVKPRSRRPSVAGNALLAGNSSAMFAPRADAVTPIEDEGESKVLATVSRTNQSSLKINIKACTIAELQHIIRSTAVRFDVNPRDRASRKTLHFTMTSGAAVTKAKMVVDAQPPLLEPPSVDKPPYAVFGGSPAEVVPYHVAPSVHYGDGGTIEFKIVQPARGIQLVLVSKYSTSTKGTVPPYELFGDGKRVGTMTDTPDKASITLNVAKGFASFVNKLVKSVAVQVQSAVEATGKTSVDVQITSTVPGCVTPQVVRVTVGMGDAANAPKVSGVPSAATASATSGGATTSAKPRAGGKRR